MTPTPCLLVIPQRHPMDCGIACLAMLLSLSYEDVLLAAPWPTMRSGMSPRQLMTTAKRLGQPLRVRRDFDVDEDTGLLMVGAKGWKNNHMVLLKAGLVFDTDSSVWDTDVFLSNYRATPLALYVLR